MLACMGILVFSSSCKRQKLSKTPLPDSTQVAIQKDTIVITTKPVDSLKIEDSKAEDVKLSVEEIDFAYLTSKSKVSFKSKDQDIKDANVNIRIKKDSLIWFNVKVLAFDVARGLFTRDGISILDMYHKDYYHYPYDSLSQKFGANLSFDLIQSLIVGNMPIKKRPKDKVSKEPDFYLLRQSEGKVLVDNYIGDKNRKLKKLKVEEPAVNNTLTMEYDEFTNLNNFLFPYSSLIEVNQSKAGQTYQTLIQIKHQKVELVNEPLTFPFTIPNNYQRKN
ncbi:MAG: DUF4292 domain-containing protein [Spirosomataceae bacterium]